MFDAPIDLDRQFLRSSIPGNALKPGFPEVQVELDLLRKGVVRKPG